MEVVGKGSVVQREPGKPRGKCRTWELSVQVLQDGKRKRRTRAFHGTWREANTALLAFRAELEEAPASFSCTFGQYARRWHALREDSGAYALKTMSTETVKIRMLCSRLEDVPLGSIDVGPLEDAFGAWRLRYQTSTLASLRAVLSNIMGSAVKGGLIAENPVSNVRLPKAYGGGKRALSPEQIECLIDNLDPSDGRQLAVLLCLTCGLRRGEVIALRWGDWDGVSIHVERADDGDGHDRPPKSRAGVRSVPAPKKIATMLEPLRREAEAPLCADVQGNRIKSGTLGRWWSRFRTDVGMDCTLHELRHSYLTQLARAGVHPRVMMQLAGHSSVKVCLEVYTHVSDEMQRDAVKRAFG